MRFLIAAILIMTAVGSAIALGADNHGNDRIDVVVLDNYAVIKGTIIERVEGQRVVILTAGGERIELAADRILLITTEGEYEAIHKERIDSLSIARYESLQEPFPIKPFHIRLGGTIGEETSLGGAAIVGIDFGNVVFLGIGAGFDFHGVGRFLPVFGEFRAYMRTGKGSGFVYLDGGYSFAKVDVFNESDLGGVTGSLGLGFDYPVSPELSLTLQASGRIQQVKRTWSVNTADPLAMFFLGGGVSF